MSSSHRIYLASAGTGKTYRLSGRFLDLLLAGTEPRSILATTFTRKAAEEILDRVLKRLVEAIDSSEAREELAELRDFGSQFGSEEALGLLVELVRGLDRFEVRTLDSFFIQVGRLFPLELGLPPKWSVAHGPEAEGVAAEALARLLEGVQGPEEEAQFAELLREVATSNGAGRSIHYALTQLVERGREVLLDSHPEAWSIVEAGEPVEPAELAGLEARIEQLAIPRNKSGAKAPKKNWDKAQKALLLALRGEDWKGVLKVGLFSKYIWGETSFDRCPIDEPWADALKILRRHVAHQLLLGLIVRNAGC